MGAGEPVDLVVLAKKVMQRLEAEGWVAPGGIKDFARSEIAIAVRVNAPFELPLRGRRTPTSGRRVSVTGRPFAR